ncbi:hypothetical protein AB0H00_14475 [Nocardia sp. NPDC023852]|uniref:hypothetical protein n=1 Tax=Nocardia sp. NPDC023852 TaxID=3154697 RepID=UPI0034013D2E
MRGPFGVRGPKNMPPIMAAPLIKKPKTIALIVTAEPATSVSDASTSTYAVCAGVAECVLSGCAHHPTATARISRT